MKRMPEADGRMRARRRCVISPWMIAYAVMILGLMSCATLAPGLDPPRVSLAGLELEELGLFEQRYRLQLRIQNPNDVDLPIAGMDFQLYLNDEEFANGLSDQKVTLPAFGEQVIEVRVTSSISSVIEQLQLIGGPEIQTFSYRLSGHVKLLRRAMKYPFEYRGEIDLTAGGNAQGRGQI